jgi:hypothetical protein
LKDGLSKEPKAEKKSIYRTDHRCYQYLPLVERVVVVGVLTRCQAKQVEEPSQVDHHYQRLFTLLKRYYVHLVDWFHLHSGPVSQPNLGANN